MTDTPIKDAFREKFPDLWRPSDKFDKAIWMLSARATLAQIKPFLDAYDVLDDAGGVDLSGVFGFDLVKARDAINPLLKELEE